MSVVISGSLSLGDIISGGGIINANNPVIGWQQRATAANISATTAAAGFPASNLANPSTNLRWLGVAGPGDQFITVEVNSVEDIDYVGIARHNFAAAQIPVSIEGLTEAGSPEGWQELVGEVILPNDGPALFRFTPQGLTAIRIRLRPGTAAPTAAVVYVGKLLVLQRRIFVGHTPINYGRTAKVVNGRSESGNFLGRIVLNESTQTSVDLQNLTPAWYRAYMEPFIQASKEAPFFFAWRPGDYPLEVGYAWMANDPQPSNQAANGMMQVKLDIGGIVK
ncbi:MULTISPECIES: hypothetical protein [Rhodomicrobium]|uniref:hypothetical protein n=1 Tax=Rhodomicrobium TaxID=1068 RepID=UPI000B4BB81A|nr:MULTISPECIES: hypothetical protein [Rhodomicrobium]